MPDRFKPNDNNQPDQNLTDFDWQRLMDTIKNGQCVLVVGPDAALNPNNKSGESLSTSLAKILENELRKANVRVENPGNLTHVAQIFCDQPNVDMDRQILEYMVEDYYKPFQDQTTPLHSKLAKLPFKFCVNTTPDSFLLQAFKNELKSPQYAHYQFNGQSSFHLSDPDERRPIIFDLYGNLSNRGSLVLTENDLLDFLVAVVKNNPPLPPYITSRFRDPKTSFLFLGFGFEQWYTRILLHVLRRENINSRVRACKSFALEKQSFFDHPEKTKIAFFFEHEHAISFKNISWQDFTEKLVERYQERYPSKPPKPNHGALPDSGSGGPLVFISYLHEDLESVAPLQKRLESRNIRVWIDKSNLRGGDNWSKVIDKVISNKETGVNYVVVVQSSRLDCRRETYVHNEVMAALERQKSIKPGSLFLIPVRLDRCDGLSDLQSLHEIDVYSPEGVDKLATDIVEDWQRWRHSPPIDGDA